MFITTIYTSLLVGLHIALALWVVAGRTLRASPKALHQRQRVHGNLVENAPLFVVVLALCELQHANPLALHALGVVFFIARLSHAYGLSRSMGRSLPRFLGAATTWNTLAAATGYALFLAFTAA